MPIKKREFTSQSVSQVAGYCVNFVDDWAT